MGVKKKSAPAVGAARAEQEHSPALTRLYPLSDHASHGARFPAEPDSVSPGARQYSRAEPRANKCIPREFRLWMELQDNTHPEPARDATQDYPQSHRAFQVVRVHRGPNRGCRRASDHRSHAPSASQRPADLLRLRPGRGRATTVCRSAASSMCRCGPCRCSCCTRCGASIARPAA